MEKKKIKNLKQVNIYKVLLSPDIIINNEAYDVYDANFTIHKHRSIYMIAFSALEIYDKIGEENIFKITKIETPAFTRETL